VALAGALAVPVLGQELSPSPSDEPSASGEPSATASDAATAAPTQAPTTSATVAPIASPRTTTAPVASGAPGADEDDEADEAGEADEEKAEGPPVVLVGKVGSAPDGKHPHFTLTVGATVYELETGPWWFWGDTHPLAAYVGKTITVQGQREGTTSIEVYVAGGTTIRAAGKPPWAGGPKVVGERHPGWKAWKADKWADGKPGNGPKASSAPTP
jgi:hypothetical protein